MLRNQLLELARGYEPYRQGRRVDADNPIHSLLLRNIPSTLRGLTPQPTTFKFEGSDGQGMVTAVPWVAAFHREITRSAKTGYYVVWLLPEDRRSLILELGLGATQFADHYGENKSALEAAGRAGKKILGFARYAAAAVFSSDLSARVAEGELPPLGPGFEHKAYGKAAILSVSYPVDLLPPNETLESDYLQFMRLYQRLADSPVMPSTDELVLDEVADPAQQERVETKVLEERGFEARAHKSRLTKDDPNSWAAARYSKASKKIGDLGERLVFEHLRQRLRERGREDLAQRVLWHQLDTQDRTPGWDITTFDADTGGVVRVEVKASQGASISEVILTRNEWIAAQKHGSSYHLYLVTNTLGASPRIEILVDPASGVQQGLVTLREAAWSLRL